MAAEVGALVLALDVFYLFFMFLLVTRKLVFVQKAINAVVEIDRNSRFSVQMMKLS